MKHLSKSHLTDAGLLECLSNALAGERRCVVETITCLMEIQDRRLYAKQSCESLYEYCVRKLHLSGSAAHKRLRAARAARQFPEVLEAIAEGRLHLSAVVAIEPHLRPDNASELVKLATHRTREAVDKLLAERFPRPDLPTRIWSGPVTIEQVPLSPGTVVVKSDELKEPVALAGDAGVAVLQRPAAAISNVPAAGEGTLPAALAPSAPDLPWARITPLSPGHIGLQVTLDEETFELFRRAQALLGPVIPGGDFAKVLQRVLRDWVQATERREYGLTQEPRKRTSSGNGRYVPAEIKRQVFERDSGRCTFVGSNGERCESRRSLEYDHVKPVARGGRTCAANLRLRCRAHNQHQAERVFGARFMKQRREGRGSTANRASG